MDNRIKKEQLLSQLNTLRDNREVDYRELEKWKKIEEKLAEYINAKTFILTLGMIIPVSLAIGIIIRFIFMLPIATRMDDYTQEISKIEKKLRSMRD